VAILGWLADNEGAFWAAGLLIAPLLGVFVFVAVLKRQPLIIDGRLIETSRRKAFDRISEAKCGDERAEDLERQFCEIAVDCIVEAYQVFNPDSAIKPERLRKRFGANCLVVGNSAVLRMWFGRKLEGPELDAQNIPIEREIRLKRPAEAAPNGNGIKVKPKPRPEPVAAQNNP
jgi:hypothetical protein